MNKNQAKGGDKDPRQAASDPQSMATLDSDMEAQITEVATKANPGDVMGAIQAYTKDGSINDAALGRIASSMGVEPDHVRGQFEALQGAFTQQAHNTVAHTGLDPETVFEWARQNDLKSLQDAISTQATERSVRGYQKVARNYISSLDTSNPEAILGAQLGEGIQARRDSSTGNIVLNIKGEDVSWKTAIRRGMIKIGKGN